jgi:hypothetical protein
MKISITESCGIAGVQFLWSAIAVPELILVRSSAIDSVVRNIAEVRTKVADAHLCKYVDLASPIPARALKQNGLPECLFVCLHLLHLLVTVDKQSRPFPT